ncbi:MAG: hydrogenase maturation nickel metallochaperone HypA [Anaerolineaceae bacterium 4572_78]|nr:MAG: hydrogenase maturation nickel metallochaperone HypA [Anaerolineaceae bacterium 4572_78]
MHELSITENLLEITLRHAQVADVKKVTQLNLVMGQMASIVDDSVQFYWDIIAKGTIAQDAILKFERIPATFHCLDCDTKFTLTNQADFSCPHCQSTCVQVIGGDEFRLDSIDVE